MYRSLLIHHLSEEVAVAPGAVGEGGLSAEPAAVGDDDVIHVWEEGVPLGQDHGIQAIRPRLFHPLYDIFHIHRQILVDGDDLFWWEVDNRVWVEDEQKRLNFTKT